MSEELVMTEKHGHVQVLTLNRPEDMNAFNTALAAALGDALDAMDNDADVRVGVLTGAGTVSYTHLTLPTKRIV